MQSSWIRGCTEILHRIHFCIQHNQLLQFKYVHVAFQTYVFVCCNLVVIEAKRSNYTQLELTYGTLSLIHFFTLDL
jgi:hypothetical protein